MTKLTSHDKRQLLLEEAERLIRTRGYAGFSYADLSAAVGIAKASIHHHFPTKEKLVMEALQSYRDRYAEQLEIINGQSLSTLDAIQSYAQLYLKGLKNGLGCLCAVLAAEPDILPPQIRAATQSFFDEHLNWLETIYASGLQKNDVSNHLKPHAAAQLILAVLEGALLTSRAMDNEQSFQVAIDALRGSLAVSKSRN